MMIYISKNKKDHLTSLRKLPGSSAAEIVVWSLLNFLADSNSLDRLASDVVAVILDDFLIVPFLVWLDA